MADQDDQKLDRIMSEQLLGELQAIKELVQDVPEIKERLVRVEERLERVDGRLIVVENIVREHSVDLREIKTIVAG